MPIKQRARGTCQEKDERSQQAEEGGVGHSDPVFPDMPAARLRSLSRMSFGDGVESAIRRIYT